MIVLTTAIGYRASQVRPFIESLQAFGQHEVHVVCDKCEARSYLEYKGCIIHDDQMTSFHPNVRRFFCYKEILRGINEPVMLADIRDVLFQGDISVLANDKIQAYTENIRIPDCPYNSEWMREISQWYEEQVICAGIIVGKLSDYVTLLWETLSQFPPHLTLDQALHNHFIYSGRVTADIHGYKLPVYTVGYVERGTVTVENDLIVVDSQVPIVVHQYDRHQNLLQLVEQKHGRI